MKVISLRRKRVLVLFLVAFVSLWLVLQIVRTGVPSSYGNNFSGRKALDEKEDDSPSELEKYADYDISPRMRRTQPGYLGKGVRLLPVEKSEEEAGYKRHSFNQLASDKISLQRALPDYRNKQ